VLIVVEVTGDYNLVLPLMLGVATSIAISRRIAHHSLTEIQMAEEGYVERENADDPLAGLRVEQVMSTASEAQVQAGEFVARPSDDVLQTIHAMAAAGVDRCVVVDDQKQVVGFLTPDDLFRARVRAISG